MVAELLSSTSGWVGAFATSATSRTGASWRLLAAVELAQAPWCWLLGSDDLVAPEAVDEIVALVQRHPDAAGATFNRTLVDRRHPSVILHDPSRLLPDERERELTREEEIFAQLGQLHDYISTQVVDRELWTQAVEDVGPPGWPAGAATRTCCSSP